jgi:hypothetical protein
LSLITFALLHLASMRIIADTVPRVLAATAQAVYGLVGVRGATAVLTLLSGWLYARFGPAGFWVMGGLCTAAFPHHLATASCACGVRDSAPTLSAGPIPKAFLAERAIERVCAAEFSDRPLVAAADCGFEPPCWMGQVSQTVNHTVALCALFHRRARS